KNDEEAPNADEMKSFHKVDKAMAKLRKAYYQVKSDTAMDSEVKRSELDRLDEEMRALALSTLWNDFISSAFGASSSFF
ncbi:hypothetical protein ACUODJ_59040, partial [Escherichia sp. HC-CC]